MLGTVVAVFLLPLASARRSSISNCGVLGVVCLGELESSEELESSAAIAMTPVGCRTPFAPALRLSMSRICHG